MVPWTLDEVTQLGVADSEYPSTPTKLVEEKKGGGDKDKKSSNQTFMFQRNIHFIVPQSGGVNNKAYFEPGCFPLEARML